MCAEPIKDKKLLNIFRNETNEHILNMTKGFLSLKDDPGNKEIIDDLCREVHTLKGSSKMMGFSNMSDISHKIEDLLEMLKEGKINFSSSLKDVIFEGLESAWVLIDKNDEGVDVKAICNKIEEVKNTLEEKVHEIKDRRKKEDRRKPYAMPEISDTVRVSVEKLDDLISLTGEIEINRVRFEEREKKFTRISKMINRKLEEWAGIKETLEKYDTSKKWAVYENISKQIDKSIVNFAQNYSNDVVQMSAYSCELHSLSMELRMLPVAIVFSIFPYAIQQLAMEYGKEVKLEISGETTKLDKKIIDGIKDPLLHIIRNAVAHGIESIQQRLELKKPQEGKISLNAYQHGGSVYIEVIDDGRGINPGRIKEKAIELGFLNKEAEDLSEEEINFFIFKPGFSTADNVSGISGRGVGMDVVKRNIERLGGSIKVESSKGKGTKIILQLPITLIISNALLFTLNNQIFAVPSSLIEATVEIAPYEIKEIKNKRVIVADKKVIPLFKLKEILQMKKDTSSGEKIRVAVIRYAEQRIAFIVDEFIGCREIVIKDIGEYLKKIRCLSGATILPGGEVVLMLHIPYLVDLVKKSSEVKEILEKKTSLQDEGVNEEKTTEYREKIYFILVVEDAVSAKELEIQVLETAGYKTDSASDGSDALNKIKTKNYDLIVSDIQMPVMDGLQMVKYLRQDEKYKDIPVVFITALGSEEDKKTGLEAGANAYFAKASFDQTQLLDTIQSLLKCQSK